MGSNPTLSAHVVGLTIDLLVEFEDGRVPGLLGVAPTELELTGLLRRPVDLRTYGDLSRCFRDEVQATAQELYAA